MTDQFSQVLGGGGASRGGSVGGRQQSAKNKLQQLKRRFPSIDQSVLHSFVVQYEHASIQRLVQIMKQFGLQPDAIRYPKSQQPIPQFRSGGNRRQTSSLFTLYVSGVADFITRSNFDKVNALLTNIKNRIIDAGYSKIHTTMFDRMDEKIHADIVEEYTGIEGIEILHVVTGYLYYSTLYQYQNDRKFLFVDLAHITRYKRPCLTDDDIYRVNVVQNTQDDYLFRTIRQKTTSQQLPLYINAIYPNYIAPLSIDFLSSFEFIRFDKDKGIITFIKEIINKQLTLSFQISGRNHNVIRKNGDFYEYSFNDLLQKYPTAFVNTLIWS